VLRHQINRIVILVSLEHLFLMKPLPLLSPLHLVTHSASFFDLSKGGLFL